MIDVQGNVTRDVCLCSPRELSHQREASKICKITYFTIRLLYDIFLTGVSDIFTRKTAKR
jgi:hypothetical protein